MCAGKRVRRQTITYAGESLRSIALPLGGIGTGQVALCGDGGLRQWQIFNNINHRAHVPLSFFAAYARRDGAAPVVRILQSDACYDEDFDAAPSISDHVVPESSRSLLGRLPGVQSLVFTCEYPVAEIGYNETALPVKISLRAYSPFVPLDPEDSSVPAAIFHFLIRNPTNEKVDASILMTQQNAAGWDDAEDIDGIRHPGYGGNLNRLIRTPNLTAIEMSNPDLPEGHPHEGQMLIAALSGEASPRAQWTDLDDLWQDFSIDGEFETSDENEPSPRGQTVNGALAWPLKLEPGSEKRLSFVLAWYFPNRYVDWEQPTLEHEENIGKSRLWVGNHYASRFSSALDVIEYVRDNLDRFDDIAGRFRKAMHDSTLPAPLIEAVSTQISVVRSPTCLSTADGRFYGFEGCHGASTEYLGDRGGCCPLNCTHVWNYAMTVARLFPQLERSMREIEWLHQQHDSGYLPHRVVLPLYLRRPWDRYIGGPPYPAIDGLLGAILKTYREFRASGDTEWLDGLWKHVCLALDHVVERYDSGDGIIHGPQPCTYDVELQGPNSFIESLYLASLRAGEAMARALGDKDSAQKYRDRFRLARKAADRLLWDGEYYVHRYDPETESVQAYGKGCHSDQLFGQWWAHALDLGHVLSPNRIERALSSIVKYNCRENFAGEQQFPRRYVRDDEAGMFNCTWPKGEKPDTPLLYSDEVWTGIEYEVAGLLLFEDMIDEAMKVVSTVRRRQDGRLRSPWNEVECGDHYVRAMSSWTLLEAAAGYVHDASRDYIAFAPRVSPENFRCFFATATGWGQYAQRIRGNHLEARLSVAWGEVVLRELRLACDSADNVSAKIGRKDLSFSLRKKKGAATIRFEEPVAIGENQSLRVSIS